jgi:uncharacterized repeat protein (TIGR04138 family)
MQKIRFDEAVSRIRKSDQRYDADAYAFLRDALDFTAKGLRFDEMEEHQHVSGPELLLGFRDFALQEFGPMALTVLTRWGVRTGEDVGAMVFQLIDVGAFGQSKEDSPEDFHDVIDLEEELRAPFRPAKAPRVVPIQRDRSEERETEATGDGERETEEPRFKAAENTGEPIL